MSQLLFSHSTSCAIPNMFSIIINEGVPSINTDTVLSPMPMHKYSVHIKRSVIADNQRAKFLLMRSGTSLKIKFILSFLMLESEGRQYKDCVFPQLGTEQRRLVFGAIFIVWFLRRPAFASLVIYTTCTNRWAGLNRQRCRSRRWSSSVEVVFSHTITSQNGTTYKMFL